MLFFENDYSGGACEKVLERLVKTNFEQSSGYGNDIYSERAKEKIRKACSCPDADVFFLVGGTQTNQTVISSLLRNFEGVVCAKTGHIEVHEAGAIESTGHKVLTLPQSLGKIDATTLCEYLKTFFEDESHEHMVYPGMVYISHPTEYGTLYTKKELEDISDICRKYSLPLFLDGARLGYGLMSRHTDVTLADIARICDVFYIGGTKVGALFGEAVVFTKKNIPSHFVTTVKQRGALLAKGRLLGVQFDALFCDGVYFEISRHAIDMAERMKEIFSKKGYRFFIDSPTNQQFIIIENEKIEELKKQVRFGFWEKYDETHSVVRFVTSWATKPADVEALAEIM